MFLCRSCLTGSEEVSFGALGLNVLVILEATMMFMKYSQDVWKSDQKTRKSQKVKCYKLLEYLNVKYYKLLGYLMVMCNKLLPNLILSVIKSTCK